MNRVAKVLSQISDDMLMHYGVARRSGRYRWGSGDNPYQHSGDFLSRVQSLKKSGMSETDIAKTMGLTTTQLRTQMSLAKDERRAIQVATAKDLREKGYSLNEIADKMGFANDSSVRSLLNENSEARMNQAKATADVLRKLINEKGMIDVGTGVERELGVSKEKLNQALYILEMEGYPIYGGGVPQVTNPGKQTNIKVICPPGTEHKDIYDYENVHSVKDYISYDGGESYRKSFEYPSSMNSNRLAIRYKEDGGINKDGVIELRRGVQDLSLGDSHYAQVRIMVDGKKYLKGMAKDAVNSFNDSLSEFNDSLYADIFDEQPTVRPVMDLSNVRKGSEQLFKMMNNIDGYSLSGSLNVANRTGNSINETRNNKVNSQNEGIDKFSDILAKSNSGNSFTNTFNIQGNNPKEIAEEVSNILQRQVERRDATWA